MSDTLRWTSADLLALSNDNGHRYEIVEGELYVSTQPDWHHDYTGGRLFRFLDQWNDESRAGMAMLTPGLVFDDDNNVIPDVIWISNERLAQAVDDKGHLTAAPELVIEVLSPGLANHERDAEVKRKLYSRRGVKEYWVVDWQREQVAVYRRERAVLVLHATLFAADELTSPLLIGFAVVVQQVFARRERS